MGQNFHGAGLHWSVLLNTGNKVGGWGGHTAQLSLALEPHKQTDQRGGKKARSHDDSREAFKKAQHNKWKNRSQFILPHGREKKSTSWLHGHQHPEMGVS